MKEMYMDFHEQLMEKYLEEHPDATDEEAYEATSDQAYNDLGDYMADLADRAWQAEKDRRLQEDMKK